jgi:transposase-like protein
MLVSTEFCVDTWTLPGRIGGCVTAQARLAGWRRHSEEFRAGVIELARRPNTSVAAGALANGLNANMLRRWVRDFEVAGKAADEVTSPRDAATALPSFVQPPSPPTASPEQTAARVEVEIHRNGTTVRANLRWTGGQPQRRLVGRGHGVIRVDAV